MHWMNNIKNVDKKFQICCGTYIFCHFVYQYCQQVTVLKAYVEGKEGQKEQNPQTQVQ